jgi:DNA-binding NarL/FixJ family response regulator
MGHRAPDRPAAPTSVELVIFSDRPAVLTFFGTLGAVSNVNSLSVAAAATQSLDKFTAAVVDVALDPSTGTAVCRELRSQRPDLPVAAVVCCPHAVTPWTLQELLSSGVNAVLDLEATAEEVRRALANIGDGGSVLHLQLRHDHGASLGELFLPGSNRGETQRQLLKLVARGLTDQEIGGHLYLSPHTVKHQIDQLRRELRVRNRTELAAWAGRQGLYTP